MGDDSVDKRTEYRNKQASKHISTHLNKQYELYMNEVHRCVLLE